MKSLVLVLFLTGCANGVVMSDEERKNCAKDGCTVWTTEELKELAKFWFGQGRSSVKGNI
jgi:hypothetical protein